jgi:hypothetical protein
VTDWISVKVLAKALAIQALTVLVECVLLWRWTEVTIQQYVTVHPECVVPHNNKLWQLIEKVFENVDQLRMHQGVTD